MPYNDLAALDRELDKLSGQVAAIIMGLRLKQNLSRGADTVVAYLLDPKIEQLLAQELKTLPEDDEIDRILAAVRSELARLPPTASRPVLLTNSRCRPLVRAVVAMRQFWALRIARPAASRPA